MKKICSYLSILICIISFTASGQEVKTYKLQKQPSKEFLITGKIDGRDTGHIILGYMNSSGKYVRDTSLLNSGKFSFKGNINQPTVAGIIGNITSNLMDDPNRTTIFLEPSNLQIVLKENSFKKIKMSGSKTQDDYDKLNNSKAHLLKPFDSIQASFIDIDQKLNLHPDSIRLAQQRDSLWNKRTKITDAISAIDRHFLTSNKTSHLTAFLLQRYVGSNGISVDSATKIFESLSPIVRQSDFGFAIKQIIYSKKLANIGDVAANFQAKDINGNIISLKEFKGKKFVLLDFWFAYCPPCRAQSPSLKKLYNEFRHKDLEIIGISRDSEKMWRHAIAEDGTAEWRHLMMSSISKTKNDLPIDLSYNLLGYPTLVLINKEGNIIHRSFGFGDEKDLIVYRELLSK
jgi:thiol-disulfide isomerase/thioredoxin